MSSGIKTCRSFSFAFMIWSQLQLSAGWLYHIDVYGLWDIPVMELYCTKGRPWYTISARLVYVFRWWSLAANIRSSCQLPDWGCPWFCPVSERNCLISRPTFTTTVPFPVQMSHLPALYLTSVLVIRRDVTSVVGASSSNNIRICGYVQMNWNFSGKRWW